MIGAAKVPPARCQAPSWHQQFPTDTAIAGNPALTPAKIEAGVERMGDLLEAGTGSAYVVEEVYQAMVAADSVAGNDASV